MSYSNISATLTSEQIAQIETQLDSLTSTLSFLVNLSPQERLRLRKMGNKRNSFVQEVIDIVRTNRGSLPVDFNPQELERDYQLFQDLQRLLIKFRPLTEALEDTAMAVGSEAMQAADETYGVLKAIRSNANLGLYGKN